VINTNGHPISYRFEVIVQILDTAFLSPPFGGLGATYTVHLRLIGKLIVDFLLMLIELFSLGVTAEALRVNIGLKSAFSFQQGQFGPKLQLEGVIPHQLLFSSKN